MKVIKGLIIAGQMNKANKEINGFSWNFSKNIKKNKRLLFCIPSLNNAISLEMNNISNVM